MAMEHPTNPQEPPPPPTSSSANNDNVAIRKKRLPTCIFDLFFDLPHPAASASDTARIVDPPVAICPLLAREMHDPDSIARLSQHAFPDHDDAGQDHPMGGGGGGDNNVRRHQGGGGQGEVLTSRGRALGAHLMKHDVYHVDHVVHHHTFGVMLGDGRTRVHGHVRRYLPTHDDAGFRVDVGRRRPRAMVLLTRAKGGERFYASVLKTAESVMIESKVNKRGCFAKKRDPARSFLHALFNAHATLITQYAELRRHGLSLNFTQARPSPKSSNDGSPPSACDTAKTIMEENEDLFRITLDKLEFGAVGSIGGDATGVAAAGPGKRDRANASNVRIENDVVRFYLPLTLQPGFECLPNETVPEDIASPIVPLLRYIGPSHFVRLISALLCERRIILISKSVTRLSTCVRAASSVLAQGLLLWKHVLIPVVPPHMIRFLDAKAPYLVGILHQFASRLGKIEGLTDVLCVNLDKNELKTLNMANPRMTVPDMLKKAGKKSSSESADAVECMARDLDEIVKADQALWQRGETRTMSANESGGSKRNLDISETARSTARSTATTVTTKQTFIEKMKNPRKSKKSLEEVRQYDTSLDAAVAFGKMIRASFGKEGGEDADDGEEDDASNQANTAPRYAAPAHHIDAGSGGVEPSAAAENEGGEEDVRAALTCFFVHMYGDMGMYLSETHGTFWLDRRKFLLRKKQLGERENAPTFVVLQKFSASGMFAAHVKSRIDDMSMTTRDRSSIMPHHIPLFDVCSKYLSVHRLDFSLINVRRIVAKTVLACTRHLAVERHIAVRTKALALTDDTPFDGNVQAAITDLVDSCHECNTNLCVVMSVVWHRLNQTDETKKTNMHILLSLHLLKNLVSHGPLTAVTEALDGAEKIYELKSYSDAKNVDHNHEVRQAADHVYSLLVDLSTLFCRRRRIAFSKARQRIAISNNQNLWSDYLTSRLDLTVDASKLHAFFRPDGVAPSVADGQAASLMSFSKLGEDLRNSRMEADDLYESGVSGDLYESGVSGDLYESGVSGDLYESGVSGDLYESGVSGDLYESGVSGDLYESGVSGDLYKSGVSGDLYESGVSGDLYESGVSGDLYESGVSGDLHESGVSGDLYESGVSGERYLNEGAGDERLARSGVSYLDESDVSHNDLDVSGVLRNPYLARSGGSGVSRDPYLDQSNVSRNSYLDQSGVGDKRNPLGQSMPPVGENQAGFGVPGDARRDGASPKDRFSDQLDQFSLPPQAAAFASENGMSVLDSFNYAISSNGAASQVGGSQYGSERSSSPLPHAHQMRRMP